MKPTRRELLVSALATAAASIGADRSEPVVAVFSKPLQGLAIDELGRMLKWIGAGAVYLTVRPDGHVLPAQVTRDLPRAAEVLVGHGVSIPMITTALTSASDPAARPILETAGKLRIPYFKLGRAHV